MFKPWARVSFLSSMRKQILIKDMLIITLGINTLS